MSNGVLRIEKDGSAAQSRACSNRSCVWIDSIHGTMILLSPRRSRGRAASPCTRRSSLSPPWSQSNKRLRERAQEGPRPDLATFSSRTGPASLVPCSVSSTCISRNNVLSYAPSPETRRFHVLSMLCSSSLRSRPAVGQAIATSSETRRGQAMVDAESDATRPSRARKLTALGEEMATKAAARAVRAAQPPAAPAPQAPAEKVSVKNEKGSNKRSRTSEAPGTENATERAAAAGSADAPTCKSCTRKAKLDCTHGRCFSCCEKVGKPCKGHEKLLKQKQEEEAILSNPIPEAASQIVKRQRVAKGQFCEVSIEALGDTVLIWSLRDFIRHKAWSKDTLEFCMRWRRKTTGRARGAGQENEVEKPKRRELRKTKLARKLGELSANVC